MADDSNDDSQKTEDPTPKKLQEAREKGEVAKSQEIGHWFMLFAFALGIGVMAPYLAEKVLTTLRPFIERPHSFELSAGGVRDLIVEALVGVGLAMLPLLGIVVVLAIAGNLLQTGIIISSEPIKPKLSKLSPLAGFKRIFGSRALVEFAKGLLKITLVGVAVTMVLWPQRDRFIGLVRVDLPDLLGFLQGVALKEMIAVLAIMAIIAGLDYLFQRFQFIKQLRMSRQEIRDEMKQSEGDPLIKAKLRQIRMERSRKRMMAAVPEADVVVTNPTHYAVALKYDAEDMAAPRVVAKGVDHLAQRIREIALENGVPLYENRPLARALYANVDLDEEIPAEHYKAVAEIIGYVMRLKGRLPGGGRLPNS